jgi:two-component system LytT family response regulator
MLQELGNEYQIIDSPSLYHAVDLLRTNIFDLFYIDIQLNNENGLKLAKHIRKIPGYELTWIVFVTSHVEYMLEAFKEIHCYDYILKPYEKSAIHNMTRKLLVSNSKGITGKEGRKFIAVDIDDIMVRIFVDEIIFIEVFGKHCVIHTIRGVYNVKNLPLIKILDMISADTLIQSHRSYAVNLHYLQSINKNRPCWEISFINYRENALVGGKYKESIMEACEKYSCSRG